MKKEQVVSEKLGEYIKKLEESNKKMRFLLKYLIETMEDKKNSAKELSKIIDGSYFDGEATSLNDILNCELMKELKKEIKYKPINHITIEL